MARSTNIDEIVKILEQSQRLSEQRKEIIKKAQRIRKELDEFEELVLALGEDEGAVEKKPYTGKKRGPKPKNAVAETGGGHGSIGNGAAEDNERGNGVAPANEGGADGNGVKAKKASKAK